MIRTVGRSWIPAVVLAALLVEAGCACRVFAWEWDDGGESESESETGIFPDLPFPTDVPPQGREQAEVQVVVRSDLDLLFVVDNSATLAEEQVFLAASAGNFAEILDQANVSYRIGVTTTDVGGVRCEDHTPERGALLMRNCLEHPQEFVSANNNAFGEVCVPHCLHEEIEIQPTTTDEDPQPAARPWLEKIAGVSNLPPEIGMVDAISCFLPPGIAGCRFESPLEAMHMAIRRMQDPGDPAHGFLRAGAHFAVVLVTDEVDCSVADPALLDGSNIHYWGGSTDATSAACWRAGVECTGTGPVWDDCVPVNKDMSGTVGVPDDQAALHPLSRYLEQLTDLAALKQTQDPEAGVSVAAITGVPVGYPQVPLVFADTPDTNFMIEFGIGPGCESGTAQAVPPPRVKEVAEAFALGADSVRSVCESDFSPALAELGAVLGVADDPPCMPVCVADTEPGAPGLQPDCRLLEEPPGQTPAELPHCLADGDVWVLPPGEPTCFYERVDGDVTPACVAEGANVEFALIRTEPVEEGTVLIGDCVVC
jgi:hypothetical protein